MSYHHFLYFLFECNVKTCIFSSFLIVTPASLKFNLIVSRVKLMNYWIYFEGDIILYYDIYKENK